MNRKQLGFFFENIAAQFYVRRGNQIVARNLRTRIGEIDLVVWRKGQLVVVEVRGTTHPSFPPHRHLTHTKLRRLATLSRWVQARYKSPVEIEFIEITGKIPNRFFSALMVRWPYLFGYRIRRWPVNAG